LSKDLKKPLKSQHETVPEINLALKPKEYILAVTARFREKNLKPVGENHKADHFIHQYKNTKVKNEERLLRA
jgi:hypothetical protein